MTAIVRVALTYGKVITEAPIISTDRINISFTGTVGAAETGDARVIPSPVEAATITARGHSLKVLSRRSTEKN